ncbi:MAG TPA: hypothetical protein VMT81_02260 [Candidatus Paceibacterota bacterium]|nr:hypothetical protein [Candidatus Paceibacterota bacterium]
MSFGQFLSSLFTLPGTGAGFLGPVFTSIGQVWAATWWFFLPLIAAIVLWDFWRQYLHIRFLKNIKWELLEIKVPKNILKTPKAMEQIFAAAHAPYSYGIKKYDKYVKGVEELFMCFELVGRAGETHFYLRVPDRLRNMMESAIFGQYPEAEIVEVEDYLKEMPHALPNADLDVAGFEEIFGKPTWYPLRTYEAFEDPTEEHRLDTIAPLIEGMSKMRGDQQFWFQLVIIPTGEDWVKKGEEEIKKKYGIEEEKKKKKGLLPGFDMGFTFGEALRAPFEHPGGASAKKEAKQEKFPRLLLSPADKELTEGIARKISKFGFETTVRFMFLERRGDTQGGVDRNMMLAHSYIRQFNTQNMNALRPDGTTTSASYSVRGMFKKTRLRWRKRIIYERYQHLSHSHHSPILNIEELATLYHFPITTVSTTELEKIESKKGAPPAALPVVEEAENDET